MVSSSVQARSLPMASSPHYVVLAITIGKGREVPELCCRGADGSCFAHMVARVCARVGTLLWAKTHMGCLLREYRCPLATWVVSEKGNHVARPQGGRCRLADFWWKRKVCGMTSAEQVPTRGFSAKKETVWRDLQKFFISLFTSTD